MFLPPEIGGKNPKLVSTKPGQVQDDGRSYHAATSLVRRKAVVSNETTPQSLRVEKEDEGRVRCCIYARSDCRSTREREEKCSRRRYPARRRRPTWPLAPEPVR